MTSSGSDSLIMEIFSHDDCLSSTPTDDSQPTGDIVYKVLKKEELKRWELQQKLVELEKIRASLLVKLQGTTNTLKLAQETIAHLEQPDRADEIVNLTHENAELKCLLELRDEDAEYMRSQISDLKTELKHQRDWCESMSAVHATQENEKEKLMQRVNELEMQLKIQCANPGQTDNKQREELDRLTSFNESLKNDVDYYKEVAQEADELKNRLGNSISFDEIRQEIKSLEPHFAFEVLSNISMITYNPNWLPMRKQIEEELRRIRVSQAFIHNDFNASVTFAQGSTQNGNVTIDK